MSETKTSKITFSRTPKYFDSITIWDRQPELQFAIDQLEARGKKYSIERRGGLIRVWSKTFSRNY